MVKLYPPKTFGTVRHPAKTLVDLARLRKRLDGYEKGVTPKGSATRLDITPATALAGFSETILSWLSGDQDSQILDLAWRIARRFGLSLYNQADNRPTAPSLAGFFDDFYQDINELVTGAGFIEMTEGLTTTLQVIELLYLIISEAREIEDQLLDLVLDLKATTGGAPESAPMQAEIPPQAAAGSPKTAPADSPGGKAGRADKYRQIDGFIDKKMAEMMARVELAAARDRMLDKQPLPARLDKKQLVKTMTGVIWSEWALPAERITQERGLAGIYQIQNSIRTCRDGLIRLIDLTDELAQMVQGLVWKAFPVFYTLTTRDEAKIHLIMSAEEGLQACGENGYPLELTEGDNLSMVTVGEEQVMIFRDGDEFVPYDDQGKRLSLSSNPLRLDTLSNTTTGQRREVFGQGWCLDNDGKMVPLSAQEKKELFHGTVTGPAARGGKPAKPCLSLSVPSDRGLFSVYLWPRERFDTRDVPAQLFTVTIGRRIYRGLMVAGILDQVNDADGNYLDPAPDMAVKVIQAAAVTKKDTGMVQIEDIALSRKTSKNDGRVVFSVIKRTRDVGQLRHVVDGWRQFHNVSTMDLYVLNASLERDREETEQRTILTVPAAGGKKLQVIVKPGTMRREVSKAQLLPVNALNELGVKNPDDRIICQVVVNFTSGTPQILWILDGKGHLVGITKRKFMESNQGKVTNATTADGRQFRVVMKDAAATCRLTIEKQDNFRKARNPFDTKKPDVVGDSTEYANVDIEQVELHKFSAEDGQWLFTAIFKGHQAVKIITKNGQALDVATPHLSAMIKAMTTGESTPQVTASEVAVWDVPIGVSKEGTGLLKSPVIIDQHPDMPQELLPEDTTAPTSTVPLWQRATEKAWMLSIESAQDRVVRLLVRRGEIVTPIAPRDRETPKLTRGQVFSLEPALQLMMADGQAVTVRQRELLTTKDMISAIDTKKEPVEIRKEAFPALVSEARSIRRTIRKARLLKWQLLDVTPDDGWHKVGQTRLETMLLDQAQVQLITVDNERLLINREQAETLLTQGSVSLAADNGEPFDVEREQVFNIVLASEINQNLAGMDHGRLIRRVAQLTGPTPDLVQVIMDDQGEVWDIRPDPGQIHQVTQDSLINMIAENAWVLNTNRTLSSLLDRGRMDRRRVLPFLRKLRAISLCIIEPDNRRECIGLLERIRRALAGDEDVSADFSLVTSLDALEGKLREKIETTVRGASFLLITGSVKLYSLLTGFKPETNEDNLLLRLGDQNSAGATGWIQELLDTAGGLDAMGQNVSEATSRIGEFEQKIRRLATSLAQPQTPDTRPVLLEEVRQEIKEEGLYQAIQALSTSYRKMEALNRFLTAPPPDFVGRSSDSFNLAETTIRRALDQHRIKPADYLNKIKQQQDKAEGLWRSYLRMLRKISPSPA
ncbi:MAG: hypothetical protein HQK60_04055 [Deltaproteobacteria bacterium]|nr:hypothetical protein [Deltaproteobacteria bacterium]